MPENKKPTNNIDSLDMLKPINDDISLAAKTLRQSLENNYIKRLYATAKNEEDKTRRSPSKEVLLLNALKNYSPPALRLQFDTCIKMFNMMSAFSNIRSKLEGASNIEMKSKKAPDTNPMLSKMSELIILNYFAESLKSDFRD